MYNKYLPGNEWMRGSKLLHVTHPPPPSPNLFVLLYKFLGTGAHQIEC